MCIHSTIHSAYYFNSVTNPRADRPPVCLLTTGTIHRSDLGTNLATTRLLDVGTALRLYVRSCLLPYRQAFPRLPLLPAALFTSMPSAEASLQPAPLLALPRPGARPDDHTSQPAPIMAHAPSLSAFRPIRQAEVRMCVRPFLQSVRPDVAPDCCTSAPGRSRTSRGLVPAHQATIRPNEHSSQATSRLTAHAAELAFHRMNVPRIRPDIRRTSAQASKPTLQRFDNWTCA